MNITGKRTHYFVVSSYLIIGLFMVIASLFSAHLERQLQLSNQKLEQNIMLKSQVEDLYQHARNRSVILFRLVNTRDIFDKDQLNHQLSVEASNMLLLMETFRSVEASSSIEVLLDALIVEFSNNYNKQSQVARLVLDGEYELASSLLVYDALPNQERALSIFRQIKAHYDLGACRTNQSIKC